MAANREIALRPAGPADAAFLISVTRRLADFPLPAWRTPGEIAAADLRQLLPALNATSDDSLVLVAETEAGEPLGCLFVTTESDFFTGLPGAHIEVIAVTAEAEGQGVGRQLMAAGESWARKRGSSFMTLNVFVANARARSVYERFGYSPETVRYRKAL